MSEKPGKYIIGKNAERLFPKSKPPQLDGEVIAYGKKPTALSVVTTAKILPAKIQRS